MGLPGCDAQGNEVAEAIKADVAKDVKKLRSSGIIPGLATVLVGENPASQVYVRSKRHTCEELGMHSEPLHLPSDTTTEQ